jgi:photosystem II stability/assembly factor-like uncharacterized protein
MPSLLAIARAPLALCVCLVAGPVTWAPPASAQTSQAGGAVRALSSALTPGSLATGPTEVSAQLTDHFNPVSVTFVSLHQGWALGTISCSLSGECLALRSTNNTGKTWAVSPLPSALLNLVDRKISGVAQLQPGPGYFGVRFADPKDGWLFGGVEQGNTFEPLMWATHDAGATWTRQPVLPGMTTGIGPVMDVEASAGKVYALVPGKQGAVLDWAPVSRNDWRPVPTGQLSWPAGGAQPTGSIVLQGGNGWVMVGNDRGITGTARLVGGRWGPLSPPCAGVGDSYSVPAARNGTDLAAVCQMGGFASPVTKAAPPGARPGSSWLYVSPDAGGHFYARAQLSSALTATFGVVAYPAPHEFLVAQESTTNKLLASFDAGHHWTTVYDGDVFYLGFTSPTQGVGLAVEAPKPGCSINSQCGQRTTVMIITFDGGHHWQQVNFGM